jgi:hypothetical protein
LRNPQAGSALVITLMLTTLIAFIGGALVFVLDVETAISANHRLAQDARDAAESGVECVVAELGRLAAWTDVPGGTLVATLDCLDASAPLQWPGAAPLDVPLLTGALQAASERRYGQQAANPDTPLWSMAARGPLRLGPPGLKPYVIVWLADDVDDGDGQPLQESNDALLVRATAFGLKGSRASVEALVGRTDGTGTQPSDVRLVSWREVR